MHMKLPGHLGTVSSITDLTECVATGARQYCAITIVAMSIGAAWKLHDSD